MSAIKKVIKRIVFHFIKPPIVYVVNTYSQAGEDSVIKFLFNGKGIDKPSYLDIGTSNPIDDNNTYLFYKKGSKGVCVEANSVLIDNIKEKRPLDVVLNVGINVGHEEEADFYMFEEGALNTFSKEEAEYREKNGSFKIQGVIKVKLKLINDLIRENFDSYPDFLSIDIEGVDLDVLQSLDFNKFPIPVICVETCTYSENHIKPKNLLITDFMLSKNYFVYGDTYINTIYVNNNWFYKGQ